MPQPGRDRRFGRLVGCKKGGSIVDNLTGHREKCVDWVVAQIGRFPSPLVY